MTDVQASARRGQRSHIWANPKRHVTPSKEHPTTFSAAAKALSLSDNALAEILNVRPDTVRQWRNGRRNAPNAVLDVMGEMVARLRDRLCTVANEIEQARTKKEASD